MNDYCFINQSTHYSPVTEAGVLGSSMVSISRAWVTSKMPLRLRRTLTLIFEGVPSGCAWIFSMVYWPEITKACEDFLEKFYSRPTDACFRIGNVIWIGISSLNSQCFSFVERKHFCRWDRIPSAENLNFSVFIRSALPGQCNWIRLTVFDFEFFYSKCRT